MLGFGRIAGTIVFVAYVYLAYYLAAVVMVVA